MIYLEMIVILDISVAEDFLGSNLKLKIYDVREKGYAGRGCLPTMLSRKYELVGLLLSCQSR